MSGRGNKRTVNRKQFYTDRQVIAVAGTAERLSDRPIPIGFEGTIKADPDNVGDVHIGTTQFNAESPLYRYTLKPGDSKSLAITDFNLVWVNVEVNGEEVLKIVEIDV